MKYEIKISEKEDSEYVEEKLNEYLASVAPPETGAENEELVFKVEDEGKVVGGCIIELYEWNWGRMLLEALWVDEKYRHQGIGSMLIKKAEQTAREKGCYIACISTTDFQARGLYEKHGYKVFTVTKDCPRGHESYTLAKLLDRDTKDYIPKNNAAVEKFEVKPGTEDDADIIENGLDGYCALFAPETHGYIKINKKIVDENGNIIAGIISGINGWDYCFVSVIWVNEAYRKQGFGSHILSKIEREAKEKGAYIMLTYASDWNIDFFKKQGYAIRGEFDDLPRGHRSFELMKTL